MRKTALIILLTLSLNASIGSDKVQHAAAGTLIYMGCILVGKSTDSSYLTTSTCLLPVIAAGIGKELSDDEFDWQDVGATVAVPAVFSVVFYRW